MAGFCVNRSADRRSMSPVSMAALSLVVVDQDDFWLNQPKIINLIAFKVIEQLSVKSRRAANWFCEKGCRLAFQRPEGACFEEV
jgi:hypothetical protein